MLGMIFYDGNKEDVPSGSIQEKSVFIIQV